MFTTILPLFYNPLLVALLHKDCKRFKVFCHSSCISNNMDLLPTATSSIRPLIMISGASILLPIAVIAIYRLYLHPLRGVPGPRFAAVSELYGFYYNVVRGGYSKQFESLHKYYGSAVVRIGPNNVHVNQADFFEEYRPGDRRKKSPS